MAKRPDKPRGKTSKSTGRRKASAAKAVVRVRDAAVPAAGPHRPNASAFKPIRKAPSSLESLSAVSRKRLVDKLIPRPEPPPTPGQVKFVKAPEPQIKRFHGLKAPLYWFPPWPDWVTVRRQIRLHVLGGGPDQLEAPIRPAPAAC